MSTNDCVKGFPGTPEEAFNRLLKKVGNSFGPGGEFRVESEKGVFGDEIVTVSKWGCSEYSDSEQGYCIKRGYLPVLRAIREVRLFGEPEYRLEYYANVLYGSIWSGDHYTREWRPYSFPKDGCNQGCSNSWWALDAFDAGRYVFSADLVSSTECSGSD